MTMKLLYLKLLSIRKQYEKIKELGWGSKGITSKHFYFPIKLRPEDFKWLDSSHTAS